MPEIIGVQFQRTGKIYSYFPNDNEHYFTGDFVIVDTSRGMKYARVALENHYVPEEELMEETLTVLRRATEEDAEIHQENLEDGREAHAIAMEKIQLCGLEMKLVNVEYAFDRSRVIFNFTADERVDFRTLIKELAAVFHTRIELRQIGVRDEAKIVGGIGICGQPLCCHRYLDDFSPVSIKMAKEQNLSLNPTKISGCCGRLLCCLNYENEVYVERNRLAKEAAAAERERAKEKAACETCNCPSKNPEAVQNMETAIDNAALVAVAHEDVPSEETDIVIEEVTPIEAPKHQKKSFPRKENFDNREGRRAKDNHKARDRRNKADMANKDKRRNDRERSAQREESEQAARRPHKRGHRGGRGRNKKNDQSNNNANNGQ